MLAKLLVILLVAIPQPLEEFPIDDSILVWSPFWVQVHFCHGIGINIQQLPLQVLDDEVLLELKILIAKGYNLDFVVEIKQGFLAFSCFFPCFLLVSLHVDESKPLLDGINKFLSS